MAIADDIAERLDEEGIPYVKVEVVGSPTVVEA